MQQQQLLKQSCLALIAIASTRESLSERALSPSLPQPWLRMLSSLNPSVSATALRMLVRVSV